MLCCYISLGYLCLQHTRGNVKVDCLTIFGTSCLQPKEKSKQWCNGSKRTTRKVVFSSPNSMCFLIFRLSKFLLKMLFFKGKGNCSAEEHIAIFEGLLTVLE